MLNFIDKSVKSGSDLRLVESWRKRSGKSIGLFDLDEYELAERMRETYEKIKTDTTNFNVVFEWRGDGRTATFENVLDFAKTTRSWFRLDTTTASPHECNVIDFEKKAFDDMVNNQRIGERPTPSLDKYDRIMECMDTDELDEFFEMEKRLVKKLSRC
jgi:hypothetical protein